MAPIVEPKIPNRKSPDHPELSDWISTSKKLSLTEQGVRPELLSDFEIHKAQSSLSIAPSQYDSAASQRQIQSQTSIQAPQLKWPSNAHPILTLRVRSLLEKLWAIVVSRALQLRFPLSETTILVVHDPSEDENKAILRLTCQANMSQALAFWDSLEPDLQNLLKNLSETDRNIFVTRISMRVYWR